jgi:chromosome segregation protein
LNEINNEIKKEEARLAKLQNKQLQTQESLVTKTKERDVLTQEERVLDTIRPLSIHAQQLRHDIISSQDALKKHLNEQKHIIPSLAILMDIDESQPTIDQLVHKKANDIETETHMVKLETHRIEKELSNFEALHLTPQRERVDKAFSASKKYQFLLPKMIESLKEYKTETQSQLTSIKQKLLELEEQVTTIQAKLKAIVKDIKELNDRYQDIRAKKALITFQTENIIREINELKSEYEHAQNELKQLQQSTINLGNRIETERGSVEISADIKVIDAHLTILKDVSEDVEHMYTSYLNIYTELKEKTLLVSENRERALTEVNERKKIWHNLVQSLLNEVNPTFEAFLEKIDATGWVTLIDPEDIEMAGLELTVGFKGAEPHVLDSRTHSGGEKSSTTMAFLLALQRHIKSPFRAVDEFDVHMDPRNRETISQMLLLEMEKEFESQYLTITPGQLSMVREDTHIITVQRIEEKSEIKILSGPPLIS